MSLWDFIGIKVEYLIVFVYLMLKKLMKKKKGYTIDYLIVYFYMTIVRFKNYESLISWQNICKRLKAKKCHKEKVSFPEKETNSVKWN